jgi:large subunit ribosomal protein L29
MTITELRELTIDELEIKIIELKKDLMDSRFLLATSQIEDTSVFKKIKKEIAQAMTVFNEKVVKENIEIKEKVKDS